MQQHPQQQQQTLGYNNHMSRLKLNTLKQTNESQSFITNLIETPPFSPERRQKQFALQQQKLFNQENNINVMNHQHEQFMTFNQNSIEKSEGVLNLKSFPSQQQIAVKREATLSVGRQPQSLQNIDDIRKSIILRESKQNSCLNQGCLQTECCLLEANRTIQNLKQQIDELYLQLMDKEGIIMELQGDNTALKNEITNKIRVTTEAEVQTDFPVQKMGDYLFTNAQNDTISSVHVDEDTQNLKRGSKSQKVMLKTQKYHKPKLMINDQEVLSPQHFQMTKKNSKIMESQFPLDIKFSLVYDESIQDIDYDEDQQEAQDDLHAEQAADYFSYQNYEEVQKPISVIELQSPVQAQRKASITRSEQSLMDVMELKQKAFNNTISQKQFIPQQQMMQQSMQPCKTVKELLGKTQMIKSNMLSPSASNQRMTVVSPTQRRQLPTQISQRELCKTPSVATLFKGNQFHSKLQELEVSIKVQYRVDLQQGIAILHKESGYIEQGLVPVDAEQESRMQNNDQNPIVKQ